jgi:predicted transcriptional regulator
MNSRDEKVKSIEVKKKDGKTTSGPRKRRFVRAGRERVLVEFPSSLLQRADEAASQLEKNRSELIRTAVEHWVDRIERKRFEAQLAAAYAANSGMNQELAEDFRNIDLEGL